MIHEVKIEKFYEYTVVPVNEVYDLVYVRKKDSQSFKHRFYRKEDTVKNIEKKIWPLAPDHVEHPVWKTIYPYATFGKNGSRQPFEFGHEPNEGSFRFEQKMTKALFDLNMNPVNYHVTCEIHYDMNRQKVHMVAAIDTRIVSYTNRHCVIDLGSEENMKEFHERPFKGSLGFAWKLSGLVNDHGGFAK